MAKHKTLAFFIPHQGCPHRCSFCDQHAISGAPHAPTPKEVAQSCTEMLARYGTLQNAEIGFFGGSFTAIAPTYQIALLETVQPFLGKGKFDGIRVSTRPDAIDETVLRRLKQYHVTAVELGAQSMSDRVLMQNGRGHTAKQVRAASASIREYGFSLGLQQMVGLYGSTIEDEYATLERLLACRPETMRIYPTAVLVGTKLAEYYENGAYTLLPWETVLNFCADALCRCHRQGVRVIRLGLHDTPSLRENLIAGYFHPAYRELAESRLYLRVLQRAAAECKTSAFLAETAPHTVSKVLGQHGSNRNDLLREGVRLSVRECAEVAEGQLRIVGKIYDIYT